MECRKIQSRLLDYADGDLGPAERVVWTAHLEQCPECQGQLEEICRFDAAATACLHTVAPTYSTQDLMARLDDVETLDAVADTGPRVEMVQQAGPHVALAAILLIGFPGLGLGMRQIAAPVESANTQIASRQLWVQSELDSLEQQPEDDTESV